MERRLNRAELHSLVSSRPLTELAKDFGISGVRLAVICKELGVATPGRGHWAKRAAGKRSTLPKLEPRGFGVPETVLLGKNIWPSREAEEAALIAETIPPAPEFAEPLPDLVVRAKRTFEKAALVPVSKTAHPIIARLLSEDAVRDEQWRKEEFNSLYRPYFFSPFERRRFRILNSILIALQRRGHECIARGKNPAEFHIRVGAADVILRVDGLQAHDEGTWRPESSPYREASEPLRARIGWHRDKEKGYTTSWQDKGDVRIEDSVREILASIVVYGEMAVRNSELWSHSNRVSTQRRLVQERREKHIAKIRAEEARIRRVEKATIDQLLDSAMSYRLAEDIRSLVDAVSRRNSVLEQSFSPEQMQAWREMALAQADGIDPLVSGSYLRPIEDPGEQVQASPRQKVPAVEDLAFRLDEPWRPNQWYSRLRG